MKRVSELAEGIRITVEFNPPHESQGPGIELFLYILRENVRSNVAKEVRLG